MTRAVSIAQSGANNVTMRNKIINGAMMIDQRNAGASITQSTSITFSVDRWGIYGTVASKFTAQQNAASVTPPLGFNNYLGITSSSAYSIVTSDIFMVYQGIEGYNIADLGWGTANAQSVTLSFWVRSSLTGTFGGVLAGAGGTRSYPFTYTINSANTWEQKTITVPGPTSGTWLTTNSTGIGVKFSLGTGNGYSAAAGSWANGDYYGATGATSVVGTSGATFYITGVQLEAGTTATPFEQRLYGTELALCQRYYQKSPTGFETWMFTVEQLGAGYGRSIVCFPVYMRTTPTISGLSWNSSSYSAAGTQAISVASFTPYLNGMSASNYLTGWQASAEL